MIDGLLSMVPRWVWLALVAALSATSCKLTVDLGYVKLELQKSKTIIAQKDTEIAESNTRAALQVAALSQAVTKAQNEARSRENSLRVAAAAAATESDGLRDDLAAMRGKYDQLSRDAIIERAAAVDAVLGQCAAKYQGMAAVAERHASDVKTLIDAWPKP